MSARPTTLKLLKDCRDYILLDRESFEEAITVNGEIPDRDDALNLAAVDELLDQLDTEIRHQEAH